MAEIWSILGDEDRAGNYTGIAEGYVSQFEGLAMDGEGNHLTLSVSVFWVWDGREMDADGKRNCVVWE